MHHRRPAAPHSHRPNHRQINRLMPFTTAPLFHALQLLETGDSARFHMPGHKGEPVFNTYADIFAIDFTETYGTGNLYTGEGPIRDAEVAAARYFGSEDCFFADRRLDTGHSRHARHSGRTRRRCPARPRGTQVRLLRLRAARHYAVFLFCTADRAIRGFRFASGQGCGSTADCTSGNQGDPADLPDVLRHPAGDSRVSPICAARTASCCS